MSKKYETTLSMDEIYQIGEEIQDVFERWTRDKNKDPRLVMIALNEFAEVQRTGIFKMTGLIPSMPSMFNGFGLVDGQGD